MSFRELMLRHQISYLEWMKARDYLHIDQIAELRMLKRRLAKLAASPNPENQP